MIYVSTGGLRKADPCTAAEQLLAFGIESIELSAGQYRRDNLERLLDLKKKNPKVRFTVHNYFPPPEKEIVLNLASLNKSVLESSIAQCREALQCAEQLGSPWYAVHAGFLLDPQPSELGKKVSRRELADRAKATQVFIQAVTDLSFSARSRGVQLLIENNVLSANNHQEFGENPFLMVEQSEIGNIMASLPKDVGLLMDVAHLKVSSKSLGLDASEQLDKIRPWIQGFHLSDNDGLSDSNQVYGPDSWFWKNMKLVPYNTIEVYDYTKETLGDQIGIFESYARR